MIYKWLAMTWQLLRDLSDDNAYEKYLEHHQAHHPEQSIMSKREFFKNYIDEKWNGIRRCC